MGMAMTQNEHYVELQNRLGEIEKASREEKARQASMVIEAFKGKLIKTFTDKDRAMFTTGEILDMIKEA
jgi:hypothetical protein